MPGDPYMWETIYGAGAGYANMFDVADASAYGQGYDMTHTHFVVWLAVFALVAVAVLGGLKVYGFHFVVKV